MNHQRLGDDFFNPHARVERGEGVLKDDLHVTAEAAQVAGTRGKNVLAVEVDAAGRGLDQAEDHASEGGLAATGLADQTQGLAGMNVERHVIHRTHFSLVPTRTKHIGACGIDLDQIAKLQERHGMNISQDGRTGRNPKCARSVHEIFRRVLLENK